MPAAGSFRHQDSCAFILDRLFKLERAQSNADVNG
jgi:hypothetical protein